MSLKGILFLLIVGVAPSAFSQFHNSKIDELGDVNICAPTIAINPRYPNNILAGVSPGNVYYTKDMGKVWVKGTPLSEFGMAGRPTILADEKGKIYYLHASDSTRGEEGSAVDRYDRIVIQSSDDGGGSWTKGEFIGMNHPKDQGKQWASTDSRGNIFVTWTQFDNYGNAAPDCRSNVFFSMSKNGKKWSDPAIISQQAGNCIDDDSTPEGAMAAASFDGKVFVAWANQEKIFLDRSFNGGEWWLSNDILVAEQEGGWNLRVPGHNRANCKPVLMSDNSKSSFRGSLYIVWADQRNGEDDTDIWFSRSHNFGDNWSYPTRVNNDGKGKHQYMPWMTVDQSTGYLYIVYYDRRNYDDNRTDVYVAYSVDGGASFKNVAISESPFVPQEGALFGEQTNISAHRGVVAPIWTRMDDGKTSIWTTIIRQEDLIK